MYIHRVYLSEVYMMGVSTYGSEAKGGIEHGYFCHFEHFEGALLQNVVCL